MSTPTPQPPSYSVSNVPSTSLPDSDEHLSLVIEGTRIISPSNPTRTLYKLSQPVLSGQAKTIGVEKLMYRVKDINPPAYEDAETSNSNSDLVADRKREIESEKQTNTSEDAVTQAGPSSSGSQQPPTQQLSFSMLDVPPSPPRDETQGPKIKYRLNHIYDIKPTWFATTGNALLIEGISKSSYQDCLLTRNLISKSWRLKSNDETSQHWKCEPGSTIRNKVKGKEATVWEWRDYKGKLVAEEVKEIIAEGDVVAGTKGDLTKTRLEFREALGEKERDVLVAAWVGRVTFEAGEKADPMTWKKFKKIAQTKNGEGKKGFYYG